MKKMLIAAAAAVVMLGAAAAVSTQVRAATATNDQLIRDLRQLEVASIADAIEQLYGQQNHMHSSMRPLFPTKFAGPAVTVMMKKEEHKEGAPAAQGMLDAIDAAPMGSVYVMVLEDGENYAGIGGLMATAMRARGLAGAVIDGGVRDVPQVQRIQFPVFSRSVVPATLVNHYRFAGANIPVVAGGVRVAANDIIVADLDGVVVVPRDKAEEVLKKAQELEGTEHNMYPFIEKFRSIREAVARFGRI